MQKKGPQPLEIGGQAVWSLSSCKPGFGVTQLRDNSTASYWQSDGLQPHFVNIQFLRKTAVQTIALYLDHRQDESYTPSKIAVRAGTNFYDLAQVALSEFTEPEGWVDIELMGKNDRPVRGFLFQIVILTNHQNGRDAHIRQIKVFEPHAVSNTTSVNFETTEYTSMMFPR